MCEESVCRSREGSEAYIVYRLRMKHWHWNSEETTATKLL